MEEDLDGLSGGEEGEGFEEENDNSPLLPHEKVILRQRQQQQQQQQQQNKKKKTTAWRDGKAPADNETNLMGNLIVMKNGGAAASKKIPERSASKTKMWDNEQEEEKYLREEWPRHEKHFFILSNVGRPIYSRYGDEQKLCSFFPILSTIANLVQHAEDTIRTIVAGRHKIVFLFKGPLYFVMISCTDEPAYHLSRQLEYLHSQMLSALTANVNRIYETRAHFDIRSLLGNSTIFLDNLVDLMDNNSSYICSMMLNAVTCLKLDPGIRSSIGNVLHQNRTDETVYSLLIAKSRLLVSIVRLRKHTLHSSDYHILLNFLAASSVNSQASSSSTVPICLPKFNDRGYLHVYVAFLIPEVALLLIATKPSNFDKEREQIETGLNQLKALDAVAKALASMKDYHEPKEFEEPRSPPNPSSASSLLMSTLGYQRLKSASMGDLESTQTALGKFSSSVISSVSASGSFLTGSQVRAEKDDYPTPPPASTDYTRTPTIRTLTTTSSTTAALSLATTTPTINSNSPLRSANSKKGLSKISATPSSSPSSSVFTSIATRQVMRRLLLHFIYKDRPTSQFTCPSKMDPPYSNPVDQKRLFRLYQHVHRLMNGYIWAANNADGSATVNKPKKEMKRMRKSHKILYFNGTRESVLGWVTPTFELYATFGPMASKAACIYACNQLLTWIKAEEVSLFIMNSPVW